MTKGLKSAQGSPAKSNIDSKQALKPTFNKQSPDRKSVTQQDKELARSYGGKPRGSLKPAYKGQPKRIKRNDTKEMFPSLAVENQAKDKLNKIVDGISKRDQDSDISGSKFERNNELRKRLERLKQEHFRGLEAEDLGDLNMDLIEEKIDEFDLNRQKEYEAKMKRHMSSNMNVYSKPPVHTSSNFYNNRRPFQNSDLLSSVSNSRITTSKAQYNSRLETRNKTRPIGGGIKRIYGNLGELVVPAEEHDHEVASRLYSPGSSVTLKGGFSRQNTQSKFDSNPRIRGLEMIYLQKLENKKKGQKRTEQAKRKARFRTLHNKFIDDPAILAQDDFSIENEEVSRYEDKYETRISKFVPERFNSNQ